MQQVTLKNKSILITGSAGFIGASLVLELLKTQSPVVNNGPSRHSARPNCTTLPLILYHLAGWLYQPAEFSL